MRRRSLLRRIAGVTALLIGSTLPYGFISLLAPNQAWPRRNHLRPPGALPNDDAFVSACIGCGLCGEVCPPRCIKFHSRDGGEGGEGGEGGGMGRTEINTPYIDPSVRACSLCGKCMEVCPTAALSPTLRKKVAMGIAQIDRTACYPWVDRGVCGACVTICPLGADAISFDFANIYRPVVGKGCVGCGLCVEICPHPSKPIWILPILTQTDEA